MFKNQLQELAQRSCFNLPSYACIREGPDHAPRFKASVNFNGEIFESLSYSPTLRQAEHAAAEVALHTLSSRGPSRSLTAKVLDETGVYKNLLQETAHKAGLNLPAYTTVRSGPGHAPIFTCTVTLAGMNFTGEPTKTKKQAEKNAAIAAWSALKKLPNLDSLDNLEVKDDSKQFRRRDYNKQAKRRVAGSQSGNYSLLQQRRLMDSALDGSTSSQKQKSFVSLFPPPPPRTASKLLPPTSSSNNKPNIPIQIRGKSEVKVPSPPAPAPPEELLDFINKSIEKESSSSRNFVSSSTTGKLNACMLESATRTGASQIISKLFGSPNPCVKAATNTMVRNMYSGSGFNPHRIRTAPAVTIRSVIPVCAAPPNRPREITTTPYTDDLPSSMSFQRGSSSASCLVQLNKSESQANSDQLNSEL